MALAHFQRTFTDVFGNVQPGLSVEVRRESDGALAALFSDAEGNAALSNPFTTDTSGYGNFYAADGRYRIRATSAGIDWRNFDLINQPDLDGIQGDINQRTIYVGSVAESFADIAPLDGQSYHATSWHQASSAQINPLGGGDFVFRSGVAKSEHNGGTVISPTVPPLSIQTSISDFLEGVGETDAEGSGCFVRKSQPIYAYMFGAYGDGTSDDTAQIQKAINSVAEVNFLELDHLLSAPLLAPVSSFVNLVGSGPNSKLINNSTDMFTVDRPWYGKFENITLETGATAGHVWSFTTLTGGAGGYSGITNSVFRDIRVIVKNPDKSVMSNVNVNAIYIDNIWENFNIVMTQGHTSHAFDFQITAGGNVGANRWNRGRITWGDVYSFLFSCSDAGSYIYDNYLEDINFEITKGGMVKGLGCSALTLNNLYLYDVNNDGNVIDHSIYIGNAGGVSSRFTTIRNCQRRSSSLATGIYDIFLDGPNNVVGAIIENCNNATAQDYKIDLNAAPEVVLTGLRRNTTIDGISNNTMILSTENFYGLLQLGKSKILSSDAPPSGGSPTSTNGSLVVYQNDSGAGSSLWCRESGVGFIPVQTAIFKSAAELSTASSSINTVGKSAGKMVFSSSVNRPVWATSGNATAPWVYSDGTVYVTPA